MPFPLEIWETAWKDRRRSVCSHRDESIWGNINLCIEIALDIYFMIGENGEGIVVPKERAEEVFSEKTVEAGKEADGCLYYPKGDTMEMPLYEMMQKRAALARKMEIAAAKQMEQIRGNGSGAADSLFAKIAPPAETEYVICCARDGIYLTGGNEMQLLVAEQLAEHFLTPYACEFARNENGMQNVALDCAGGSGGDGCTSDLCGVLRGW